MERSASSFAGWTIEARTASKSGESGAEYDAVIDFDFAVAGRAVID